MQLIEGLAVVIARRVGQIDRVLGRIAAPCCSGGDEPLYGIDFAPCAEGAPSVGHVATEL